MSVRLKPSGIANMKTDSNKPDQRYAPNITIRLLCWFGIYLLGGVCFVALFEHGFPTVGYFMKQGLLNILIFPLF